MVFLIMSAVLFAVPYGFYLYMLAKRTNSRAMLLTLETGALETLLLVALIVSNYAIATGLHSFLPGELAKSLLIAAIPAIVLDFQEARYATRKRK